MTNVVDGRVAQLSCMHVLRTISMIVAWTAKRRQQASLCTKCMQCVDVSISISYLKSDACALHVLRITTIHADRTCNHKGVHMTHTSKKLNGLWGNFLCYMDRCWCKCKLQTQTCNVTTMSCNWTSCINCLTIMHETLGGCVVQELKMFMFAILTPRIRHQNSWYKPSRSISASKPAMQVLTTHRTACTTANEWGSGCLKWLSEAIVVS